MKKLYEYAIEEQMDIYLLIKSAETRMAKNGRAFIAFTFQDTTGQIDGKYWSATEEDIAQFTAGKIVRIAGKREI